MPRATLAHWPYNGLFVSSDPGIASLAIAVVAVKPQMKDDEPASSAQVDAIAQLARSGYSGSLPHTAMDRSLA